MIIKKNIIIWENTLGSLISVPLPTPLNFFQKNYNDLHMICRNFQPSLPAYLILQNPLIIKTPNPRLFRTQK